MSDMTTNLRIWSTAYATDPKHTKPFTKPGGNKGTSVRAHYVVMRLTEIFGPVGIGWGFVEREHLIHEGVWFSKVVLWYVDPATGVRGEVEHWGGQALSQKRKEGNFFDDDAPKKALTDGLTKAASLLGIAADVYMGQFDDNKYVNDMRRQFTDAPPAIPSNNKPKQLDAPVPPQKQLESPPAPRPALLEDPDEQPARVYRPQYMPAWKDKPIGDGDWVAFEADIMNEINAATNALRLSPLLSKFLSGLVVALNKRHPHLSEVCYTDESQALTAWDTIADKVAKECRKHGVTPPQKPEAQEVSQ